MPLAETFSRLSQVETSNELDQNLLRQLPSPGNDTKNDSQLIKVVGQIELKHGKKSAASIGDSAVLGTLPLS